MLTILTPRIIITIVKIKCKAGIELKRCNLFALVRNFNIFSWYSTFEHQFLMLFRKMKFKFGNSKNSFLMTSDLTTLYKYEIENE